MNQTNTTRTAILKTNETFDYDRPGKMRDTYSRFQMFYIRCNSHNKFLYICLVGAPRVWYLFILATDHGKPQRQCKNLIFKIFLYFFLFLIFLAFCSLRINLRDVNDNPPSKIKSINKIFYIINLLI